MGWGFATGEQFIWPSELKKSAFAKAGKTGKIDYVLDSLTDAEKFHDGQNPPYAPGQNTETAWEIWEKQAAAFLAGPAKKTMANLMLIKKRAANALADKEIAKDKDCKAALTAIGKSCDTYLKDVQPGVLKSKIESMRKDGEKRAKEAAGKLIGPSVAGWKSASGKGHPQIGDAKKLLAVALKQDGAEQGKTLQTFASTMQKAARIMTQNIGNIIKCEKQGFTVPGLAASDYAAMNAMYKAILPVGNASGDWTGGSIDKAKLGFKTVNAHTQLFDQIGKKMKV